MLFLEIPLTATAVHGAMVMSHTAWQRLENLETETDRDREEGGKRLRGRRARTGIG